MAWRGWAWLGEARQGKLSIWIGRAEAARVTDAFFRPCRTARKVSRATLYKNGVSERQNRVPSRPRAARVNTNPDSPKILENQISPGGIDIFLTKIRLAGVQHNQNPTWNFEMTIKLSDADHDRLTILIYIILDAASARQVSRMEAMAAFAHVITAATIGNERELRGWLEPRTVSAWMRACSRNHLCPQCGKNPCVLVEHFGSYL